MKTKRSDALLDKVRVKIEGMDERMAFSKLIEAGVSISLATKLVADRYKVGGLRDETKGQLQKFLFLAS